MAMFTLSAEPGLGDPFVPPAGAWCRHDQHGLRLGATTRHHSAAFVLPFMLVWTGVPLVGIYGAQFASGTFNPAATILGLPFLLAAVMFWPIALRSVCGRVELIIHGDELQLFTGVGPVGTREHFAIHDISGISDGPTRVQRMGVTRRSRGIRLMHAKGDGEVVFATGLTEPRRRWLLQALRELVDIEEGRPSDWQGSTRL